MRIVLPDDAAALAHANSYLWVRSLSLLPALWGSVGFCFRIPHSSARDASGVQGAAYSITMLWWGLGGVWLSALQASAATLVPSERASAEAAARDAAVKGGRRGRLEGRMATEEGRRREEQQQESGVRTGGDKTASRQTGRGRGGALGW
jgi:hypothetical protein